MMTPRWLTAALLAGFASAGGCYDTKLIDVPDERGEDQEGGAAGASVPNPQGEGGEPSSGGAAEPGAHAGGEAGVTLEGGAAGDRGEPSAGTGAGGRASGGRASGGAPGAGTAGADSGGAPVGGKPAGGGASGAGTAGSTTGGSDGTGGTLPLPGVTWLSLEADRAPAPLAPNSELGIDGKLYAYADDCATLQWDAETRCASGVLCAPGPNFQNWGIAVGFYFDTTGPDGEPPDVKHTWDPNAVGVEGVAWRLRGDAPALQLWVLNMDPAHGGECAEDSCEILGPPDGTSTPALQGSLSFSRLHKDDWNGSGVVYEFDPEAVHALQFKLPAVVAGAVPFSFCVDALGLVRP